MRGATCFSGIGAPEMGLPECDWVWHADIEPFPCAVMAQRHPLSIDLGDVLAHDFIERALALGPLDLLAGGPPCQGFSVAGLRGGMADPRGNLSLRWVQIIHAIRPRNAITENVPGWLSMPDNAFGCFLAGLVGADSPLRSPLERGRWPNSGMVDGPRGRAAWTVKDAQYFGVAQRRRRVFVVADFGDGADPAEVLFERQGRFGNPAPSRETGQRPAPTLAARTRGGGGLGTDFHLDGGQTAVSTFDRQSSGEYGDDPLASTVSARDYKSPTDVVVARTLLGKPNDSHDPELDTYVAAPLAATLPAGGNQTGGERFPGTSAETAGTMLIAHTLRGEGFYATEDGTGRGTPIVPVDLQNMTMGGDIAGTLDTTRPTRGGGQAVIAFSSKDYGNDATNDLSPTLRSMSHAESHANGGGQMAVAFQDRARGDDGRGYDRAPPVSEELVGTLETVKPWNVAQEWAVRRLTPVECERLQGFPDGYTQITYRGKPAADGPRYKALGNSWAVPCGRWILSRIARMQQHKGPER